MRHIRTHVGRMRTHMGYIRTHRRHIRTHLGHIRTRLARGRRARQVVLCMARQHVGCVPLHLAFSLPHKRLCPHRRAPPAECAAFSLPPLTTRLCPPSPLHASMQTATPHTRCFLHYLPPWPQHTHHKMQRDKSYADSCPVAAGVVVVAAAAAAAAAAASSSSSVGCA